MAEQNKDEIYEYIDQIKQLEGEIIRLNKELADAHERNRGIKQSYDGFLEFQMAVVQLRQIGEPEKIIKEFFPILKKFLPYNGYYLFTDQKKWKGIITRENIPEEFVSGIESDGIFEWVLNSGHPIVLPTNNINLGKTSIIVPLLAWGERIGAILLTSDKDNDSFSAFDLELINLMATQAAQSAQNAYFFTEVQRTRDFLDRVINSYSDFIISTDSYGRISFCNATFNAAFPDFDKEKFIFNNMIWQGNFLQNLFTDALKDDRMVYVENEVKIGKQVVPYRWNISRFELEGKDDFEFLWIGTNLKEEKKKEIEKIQEEKLKSVLQVTRSVSHEINSPLTALMGNLEILITEKEADEETSEIYRDMLNDLKRIGEISQKLQKVKELTTREYYKGNEMISLE